MEEGSQNGRLTAVRPSYDSYFWVLVPRPVGNWPRVDCDHMLIHHIEPLEMRDGGESSYIRFHFGFQMC